MILGWDDVGDFSSLAELLPAEANQPRILGDSHYGTRSPFLPYALHLSVLQSSRNRWLAVSSFQDPAASSHALELMISSLSICQIPYLSPRVLVRKRLSVSSKRREMPDGSNFFNHLAASTSLSGQFTYNDHLTGALYIKKHRLYLVLLMDSRQGFG